MFDSPIEHCPVCGQMVVLDRSRAECANSYKCAPDTECPLRKYFTGVDEAPAKEESRDQAR